MNYMFVCKVEIEICEIVNGENMGNLEWIEISVKELNLGKGVL